MEQDALFNFINETFNRIEKRVGDISSQVNAGALETQRLTGAVEQFNRRLEFDLKVYLDGQEKKLNVVSDTVDNLKRDRVRVGTVMWVMGILWTIVTVWAAGLGHFISGMLHKQI